MDRALTVPRDDELFPFWASLALEFLARATLSGVSPLLLAEVDEPDGRNLLHALGLEPKVKNFIPKSIQTSEVLARCEQVVPDFTKDLELFCRGLANKRNEELHSGGTPFNDLPNHSWLPRFYEAAKVLLKFQKKSLPDFLGPEEARAGELMLKSLADEAAVSVKKLIAAHGAVWESKEAGEKKRLSEMAVRSALPYLGHVVACPACQSKALLMGENIRRQPYTLEQDKVVVRSVMLPNELRCEACGLTIKGHNMLYAAGLGSQYTKTVRIDPVDFYAEEEDDDKDDEEEFNNE
jgi:hypothetical protein